MKNFLNSITMIFICFAVFWGTKYYYSKQIRTVEVVREVEKIIEKKAEISGETIRYSMANIGKLCTAEYSYTHVERVDSTKEIYGFDIPFTSTKFIYSYDGNVMAGLDFTKIEIYKDDKIKRITVKLPDVEIMSSEVYQDSFQLYDEKNSIFNPIGVTGVADSFANLKNSEVQKAIDKGLLDRARENAIVLVENFMHGSYDIRGYDIEVVFDAALTE